MYKNKKRSCGLCKPHKRGWVNRWKSREYQRLLQDQKEIKNMGE